MSECPTNKARYASYGEAAVPLRAIKSRRHTRHDKSGRGPGNLHPYRCDLCHGWHLGSQHLKRRRAKR